MRRSIHRHRSGFTLVEALAAGMILAVSAGAIGSAVSHSLQSLRLARDTQRAAELLDQTVTRIDLIGPERLLREGPLQGAFDRPDEKYSWEATITSRSQGHLYDVSVLVSWPEGRGRRTAQVQTRLNDPPGSRNTSMRWSDL